MAGVVRRRPCGRIRVAPITPRDCFYQLKAFYAPQERLDAPDQSLRVLAEFVENVCKKSYADLVKEYQKVDQYQFDASVRTSGTPAFALHPHKNRYSDVLCREDTRVRLWFDVEEGGDYIHANWVRNPDLANKFICTQGPINSTVNDFWRMVFQERVSSILMLCKAIEDGKLKCAVYWPEKYGESKKCGNVVVTNEGEEATDFHSIRLRVELANGYEPEHLTAEQRAPVKLELHRWTSWPDRGVPSSSSWIMPLILLRKVEGTCVVHCSAGIGRTGTIMALELALQRVNRGRSIDCEAIVAELRKARAQAVQTEIQYMYLHRVLIEYAIGHTNLERRAAEAGRKWLEKYDSAVKKL